MTIARVEHANITVQEPLATAKILVELFDWSIRWQGEAIHEGFTVHVGGEDTYLALYTKRSDYEPGKRFYFHDNDGLEFEIISYA